MKTKKMILMFSFLAILAGPNVFADNIPYADVLSDALQTSRCKKQLYEAVQGNNLEEFDKFLIDCEKLDIDTKLEDGRTALMIASDEGYIEMAELLIQSGASVSAIDNNEKTALTFAIESGHAKMIELLEKNNEVK